jgi:hypothetical protein
MTGTVVAVAQLALAIGEPGANRKAGMAAVAEAALAGARLVVLPELSDSGYVFTDAGEARSLASPAASSPTLRQWRSLAATHDVTIAGGFCELGPDGKLYNSAAIVDASGTGRRRRRPRRPASDPARSSRRRRRPGATACSSRSPTGGRTGTDGCGARAGNLASVRVTSPGFRTDRPWPADGSTVA